jgi:hypothetical protein
VSVCVIGVLLVSGAALELGGIALVGWDVWDAGRTLKDMSTPGWQERQPEESRSLSLFGLMAFVAAGHMRRRAIGVALFACGVIVQTVANVDAL